MSLRLVRLACILTGAAIFVAAATMIPSDILFLKNADVAEGTVVEIKTSNGNVSYRPIVSFQTEEGQLVEAEHSVNASPKKAIPQIGEKVQVYYQPGNPENIKLINLRVDLIYLASGVLLVTLFFYLGRIIKLFR